MPTELPDWIAEAMGPVEQVHASFDALDSGNVAFGLTTRRDRWFVKLATTPDALEGLIRAARLHHTVSHPAIVPLEHVLRSVHGTALVFPWVDGRSLYAPAPKRSKARSGPGRFRELPVGRVLDALGQLIDAHCAIAGAGFVSSDLYDGSLIYDFDAHELHVIDFDEYRSGPFALEADRAQGSDRFMAPEEHRRGALIDQRTTVFHLARAASILLDTGDDTGAWRASEALHEVALRGAQIEPDARFPSVRAFAEAWAEAQ